MCWYQSCVKDLLPGMKTNLEIENWAYLMAEHLTKNRQDKNL